MELSAQQLEQFDRDGFLVFPDLFARNEVAVLRREVARLSQVTGEEVVREHTGGVRTIFRVHENDGPTRSRPFRALVRTPRLLRPVQQVLKDARSTSTTPRSTPSPPSRARCGNGTRITARG